MAKLSWNDLSVVGRPAGVADLDHADLRYRGEPISDYLRDVFRLMAHKAERKPQFPERRLIKLSEKQAEWLRGKENASAVIRRLIDDAMFGD